MKKIFILLFVLASFAASAQYDSTRVRQKNNTYGYDYNNLKTLGSNIIPLDTFKLAVQDSGGIAYKGGFIWAWNGYKWTLQAGGVIIDVSDGVDSVTYSSNELCQWVDGESTCYRLNKFFDSSNTVDGKIYYYNNGILRDSLDISDTLYNKYPLQTIADTLKLRTDSMPNMIMAGDTTDMPGNGVPTLDMVNARMGGGGGGGVSQSTISDTLKNYANSGSITTDNVVYSTPIALSVSNHLLSGAFALKSQSAYTLFGRGSGSGTPSFLASIDSNWIPSLHSESYYNTKYLGSSLPSQTGNSGKWLTTNGTTASWATNTGWSTSGNANTDTSNFLGTTDNKGFIFKTNNTKAFEIGTDQKATFYNKLTVYDNTYNFVDYRRNSPNDLSIFRIYATGDFNPLFMTVGSDTVFYYKRDLKNYIIGAANPTLADNGGGTVTGSIISKKLSLWQPTSSGEPTLDFWNDYSAQCRRAQIIAGTSVSGRTGYLSLRVNTGADASSTTTEGLRINHNLNVLIGTSTDAASAILNVNSTTKGVLIPRMTKTQRNAIASPAPGLMVIVTGETGGEYLSWYNSSTSAWVKVSSTAD